MKKNTEKQDTKFETIELEGSVQDPKLKKIFERALRRAMRLESKLSQTAETTGEKK